MCGILAIARSEPGRESDPLVSPRALERAMDRLRRRGPDAEGAWRSRCGRVLFGHTRLAIQDLSAAGRQPMTDSPALTARDGGGDERVVITYNGEVYNAPALRRELEQGGTVFRSHSDTEVLLRGYITWGLDRLLSRVCGMFAFVIADSRESGGAVGAPLLHAAVDPAGMKPLIWSFAPASSNRGERLAIASDCDAIIAALGDEPGFDARLNGQALCHILSVGCCPPPITVWRNLFKLGPGEKMTWRVGDATPPRIERYWSAPDRLEAESHSTEQAESLIRSVVDEHLLADVPVGLFLSAGLDSSAVALALAQAGRADDVTAYTLTSRGIDPAWDESPIAARLAANMMMRHRPLTIDDADISETLAHAAAAFDEPQGFTALLTATRIARLSRLGNNTGSRPGPAVVLAGDGGDETFGGYAWHARTDHPLALHHADSDSRTQASAITAQSQIARTLSDASADPKARDAASTGLAACSYTHRYLRRIFAGFHPAESRALLGALEPDYDHEVFAAWLAPEDRPSLPHPRRAQRLDIYGFCAGSILPKIDRAAMSVGLELRAPFLDRRMLDWALARAVEDGEGDPNSAKPPLRRFLGRGVEAGLVPREVLSRPKQGFSMRVAEKQPFHTLAPAMLPQSRLVRDGMVRADYASFLPANPEARESRLFTLCMMAAWYEQRATRA